MLQINWLRNRDPKLYSIFFLGFASGLPFLLILSTLSVWLAELGISKTMIGLLAWVSVPYSLKFLLGPLVDNHKILFLHSLLGLRRSWILFSQLILWIAIIGLGNTDPLNNLWLTAAFALLIGVSSAVQDIAIEAYRIEILPSAKVAVGASALVLGYRFGMLCAGAGTIFFAAYFNSWSIAYSLVSLLMLVGILTTLCSHEPQIHRSASRTSIWMAVKYFVQQNDWQIIIPFIMSYKIADTVLNVMNMPFLVEIGFSKLEIAYVAKTFGIAAMIIGGIVGGLVLSKQSMRQNLLICVVLQAIASFLFVIQAQVGHNISFLFFAMGLENFACGLSQVALIAYMSQLCSLHSTGMHYAILSSFASFVRVGFSVLAGWLADQFVWPQFYAVVCISCLPSLLLLIFCVKHFARTRIEITAPQAI